MMLSKVDDWLVAEWRKAWKMLSVWVFAMVGIAPDLHAGVVAMGWLDDGNVPPAFVWSLRGLAVIGIAGRLLRQHGGTSYGSQKKTEAIERLTKP